MIEKPQSLTISVVIPAHNEEKLIPRVLESLLQQTHDPNEVIIVDNASDDLTKEVALTYRSRFQKKSIKFCVLTEINRGSAHARNKGFFSSISKIIASTDADTVPHPDWIHRIHRHFSEHDSVAVTGISIIKDSNRLVYLVSSLNWYKYLTFVLRLIFGFQTITTANAAIKKEVFEKVSGFNTNCTSPDHLDDTELSSRLSRLGNIRVDTAIKVNGSFRRYQPFSRAISSSAKRLNSWVKISKEARLH